MEPKKFEVKNWCQFSKKEFEYKPGVTAVVAPNGSGKTNFFDVGQFFAWTGILQGDTSKSDVVKWGEEKGSASVTFDHNGIEYLLTWNIPGSKCSLVWSENGEIKTLKKSTEITAKMEEMLGMPPRMFRDVSFVGQGDFMKVITNKQARTEYFNRITDTKRLIDIRSLFVKGRSDIPAYQDVSEDLEKEKGRKTETEKIIEEHEQEYNEFMKDYNECIERYNNLSPYLNQDTQESMKEKIKSLEKQLQELKQQEPERIEAPAEPQYTVSQLNTVKNALDNKKRAEKEIEELEQEIQNLTPPEKPDVESDPEEDKMYQGLKPAAELSEKKEKCVLCGRELQESFSSKEFKESAEAAEERINSVNKYKSDYQSYEQALNDKTDKLQQKKQELSNIQIDPGWEKVNIEPLMKEAEEYDAKYKEFQNKEKSYQDWETNIKQKTNELETVKKQQESLPTEETKDKAVKTSEELKEKQTKKDEYEQSIKNNKADLQTIEKEIARLQDQEQKRKENEKYREMLEKAAEIFHSERLPRRIMTPFLQPYNRNLSYYLNQFGVNYVCRMTPEFDYQFDVGYGWKDASRMSGGQKVNLALCSYLSTMNVVVPSCPLQVLDEPTDSLDTERKEGLVSALKELNASGKGLYIIVITHDEMVKEAADYVVNLENE